MTRLTLTTILTACALPTANARHHRMIGHERRQMFDRGNRTHPRSTASSTRPRSKTPPNRLSDPPNATSSKRTIRDASTRVRSASRSSPLDRSDHGRSSSASARSSRARSREPSQQGEAKTHLLLKVVQHHIIRRPVLFFGVRLGDDFCDIAARDGGESVDPKHRKKDFVNLLLAHGVTGHYGHFPFDARIDYEIPSRYG